MIGDLYNANNVIVGQAAAAFAPAGTALPSFAGWNQADPFDPTYFFGQALTITGATALTLTYVKNGVSATSASLTVAGLTAAQIKAALEALPNIGAGRVTVKGSASPFTIGIGGTAEGGVLTTTPTGGTATIGALVWTPCGATDQGWQFGANKSTQTIGIEEQSTPVATTITSQAVTIGGSLSEDITRTLALALNALQASTAPTSTTPGFDTLTLTDTPTEYAVALVTTNPEGFGRLIYAPAWTQLSNVTTSFRRATDKRMFPVSFETVCATNLIQVFNFTQSHS